MTQITRKSVPTKGLVFLLAMFLSAGLVLSGCGEDDPAPTPAPTPPPAPAPEPEPSGPGVPGGVKIAPTSATELTISWDAVEGADGYDIQVSLDATFDDADPIVSVTETSFTATVPAGVSGYARVRATTGEGDDKVSGDWSDAVMGSAPLSVTFSLPEGAKSSHFFVAGSGSDAKTAKATVNNQITVTSTGVGVIVPAFVEDAAGVTITAGASQPFANVNWEVLQSVVLAGGGTFVVTGADGSTSAVTCGPFGCATGTDAPEITVESTGLCAAWDPSFTLEVGMIDNDGVETGAPAQNDGDLDVEDGIELGWVYSSAVGMSVTHSFGTYASGSKAAAKGTNAHMTGARGLTSVANGGNKVLTVAVSGTTDNMDVDPCGAYGTTPGSLLEPRGCFRVHSGLDYISNYELTAKASVSVGWGATSFKDLSCEPVTHSVADDFDVDVCALFEAEVNQLHPSTGVKVAAYHVSSDLRVVGFDLSLGGTKISQERFTEVWYHDGTTSGPARRTTARRQLYVETPDTTASRNKQGELTKRADAAMSTTPETDPNNLWVALMDVDGDPLYGDLGKVDAKDGGANSATGGDGKADNYSGDDSENCSAADGGKASTTAGKSTLCDATASFETTVVYTDNVKVGSADRCSVSRTYTVSCTWDASGELGRGRTDPGAPTALAEGIAAATTEINHFLSCSIK